jgi:hypothetical protein
LPVSISSAAQRTGFALLLSCGTLLGEPTEARIGADSVTAAAPSWAWSYTLDAGGEPGAAGGAAAPRAKNRAGLRRDTAYLLSYQVVTIGILYALPESVSNWSDEQKESYSISDWWENITNPQWDTDKYYLNYILHPYWGAGYYVRSRENGYDERASFWYSAAMSAAFEFGAEALFEQPSIQDLIITPVAGTILGEHFMRIRKRIVARGVPGEPVPFGDRLVLVLTDPIGAINRQVQSWLGLTDRATFQPYYAPQRIGALQPYAAPDVEADWVYGLRVNYRW